MNEGRMSEYNYNILKQLAELEKEYGSFENMPPEVQEKYRDLQLAFRFE